MKHSLSIACKQKQIFFIFKIKFLTCILTDGIESVDTILHNIFHGPYFGYIWQYIAGYPNTAMCCQIMPDPAREAYPDHL